MELAASRSPRTEKRSYHASLDKLNAMSVQKQHQAYRDIDWDAPENRIEPGDPRFVLRPDSPLGASSWYRNLPDYTRAQLGLEMTCQVFKYGIGFEAAAGRGLLELSFTLPNRSAEYRYALHEVIEEAHHSLMFQEFINRSGCDPRPEGKFDAFVGGLISRTGATFPELFFFCVLAGEVFIDYDNRAVMRSPGTHPLLRRVLQIHVTEEARHVHFAELFLRERVPQLSRARRRFIEWILPTMLRDSQRFMLVPAAHLVERYGIPREVMSACYGRASAHRKKVEQIAAPVFALLGEPYAAEARVFG
jgi:hypothetical protein